MTAPEVPLFSYKEWLEFGIRAGFCSTVHCAHHQVHASEDEELFHNLLEQYQARDFCWPVVRLRTLTED